MVTLRQGGRRRAWLATVLAIAALTASCTSSGDAVGGTDPATTARPPSSTPSTAPATDAPTVPDTAGATPTTAAGSTGTAPIERPDPTGLPSISEPDGATVIGTLDNGLRYLVRENDNPGGRVDMRLVVDAGSALESDDQSGVAHFLEHMLFNGTEQFPENELVDVLRGFGAAFGADINASTTYDETVYTLTMPSGDDVVATGLDVLEQWLTAATLDPAQVTAERGVVLDEWRGSAASVNGRIFDRVEELFLGGSPYAGRQPIGTDAAIDAMTDEPLRRFYDDWYRPDNAAVIVVGDIDAGEIEDEIRSRFDPVAAAAGAPQRPELTVVPSTAARASVLADPDVAQGFVGVTLPLATTSEWVAGESPEAQLQHQILDDLAFDVVATRLQNDARRGDAPFEEASTDSNPIVRALSTPEVVVAADGSELEAAAQAVLDEYERVRRYGFTEAEVARAVSTYRSGARSIYEGRESRQDSSFADEFVRHVLQDEPIPTAQATYDFVNEVLDRATPATVAYGLVDRLSAAAPHLLVVVPQDEAADVPDAAAFERMADAVADRPLERRSDDAAVGDALMAAPDPVEEDSAAAMVDDSPIGFVDPVLLTFPNGVRVALNVTPIEEGNVTFGGRRNGGLAVVDLGDVADADAAGPVVDESGVAGYDPVALDAFLADKDLSLGSRVDQFTDRFDGDAATDDLETLFALVHLRMTEPRVDDVALGRYVDDELAYASDPSVDPGYAEFVALRAARYDDPRFLLPTVDSLATVDAAGIEAVYRDHFGDASGWTFALSGDFDMDTAIDLARRYLGTLPGAGTAPDPGYDEPPPPPGIVTEQVVAGDGEQASLTFLYTAPATPDRRDDVAGKLLAEIVGSRLREVVRERLGDSYSAFSDVQITGGGTPDAQTLISVSTGRDLVDAVSAAVLAELDSLRQEGPDDTEMSAASETVFQQLQLFNNPQIVDEVLSVLTDPAGNPSLDAFLHEADLVGTIDAGDVAAYLSAWAPVGQYIEITTVPR